jgi:hypothetical protein
MISTKPERRHFEVRHIVVGHWYVTYEVEGKESYVTRLSIQNGTAEEPWELNTSLSGSRGYTGVV